MERRDRQRVDEAFAAAVDVLMHNRTGPCRGLPRTAGWGYPEPYTRDLMIAGPGMMLSGRPELAWALRRTLEALASNRSPRGHIPSLAHDAGDKGASDTTPLFLLTLAMYRRHVGETEFLADAAAAALSWMAHRSPDDEVMVAQLPTSDWRDEQWCLGYGLYVNAAYHGTLVAHGRHEQARVLRQLMSRLTITAEVVHRHVHEGLVVRRKPYYAFWSYKLSSSERFDLLGNTLAILTGVAPPTRARAMIAWIEDECDALRAAGDLAVDLPPNFFPYVRPEDPDWRPRYAKFNPPGDYHNGGVWPFICGFYVAACVAAGRLRLARRKLLALTELVTPARDHDVRYGFNEWFRAPDGSVQGQDWQTWSAAMYVYAVECVRRETTPMFDEIRAAVRH